MKCLKFIMQYVNKICRFVIKLLLSLIHVLHDKLNEN